MMGQWPKSQILGSSSSLLPNFKRSAANITSGVPSAGRVSKAGKKFQRGVAIHKSGYEGPLLVSVVVLI